MENDEEIEETIRRRMESLNIEEYPHVPFSISKVDTEEMIKRSELFYEKMNERRSVRFFSSEKVPDEVILNILKTAGSAPSGANKQPWTFVVVSDEELRKEIRIAAENEEKISYSERMPIEWLKDLAPLATDWRKPFLEEASHLIILFRQNYELGSDGTTKKHYYVSESVGIAAGFLIAAIHNAGLVTLTHTPSPMGFLGDILDRPKNEKAMIVFPVGYPAKDATIPLIAKKELDQFVIWK